MNPTVVFVAYLIAVVAFVWHYCSPYLLVDISLVGYIRQYRDVAAVHDAGLATLGKVVRHDVTRTPARRKRYAAVIEFNDCHGNTVRGMAVGTQRFKKAPSLENDTVRIRYDPNAPHTFVAAGPAATSHMKWGHIWHPLSVIAFLTVGFAFAFGILLWVGRRIIFG